MLDPEKNTVPERLEKIYLMGICGVGMSALAGILRSMGYKIKGSDSNFYPPVSELLLRLGIPVYKYSPENLKERPDLVIIGNVIKRDNPELLEILKKDIHYLSFPQAVKKLLLRGKKSIVIAGTHGKTTTTALISWILRRAGLDPSFIIGGIAKNFDSNFYLGKGEFFVIEGDEYDSAFFDKRPKFLHYDPCLAVITNIEFDHADIYKDISDVILSFRSFIKLIPEDGILVYNRESYILDLEAKKSSSWIISYGTEDSLWYVKDTWTEEGRTFFLVCKEGKEYMKLSTLLYGRHNLSNILAGIAISDYLGIPKDTVRHAVEGFKGVKRRLEHIGEKNGILVIDDFAHHPTEVRESLRALRERFPKRRIIAVFEPRTNSSRRDVFQKSYVFSFDSADIVMIPEPPMMEGIPEDERFSSALLVEDLKKRGLDAYYFPDKGKLLSQLLKKTKKGDIVIFMSNGIMENLPRRFLFSL